MPQRLPSRLGHFVRDRAGAGAIEFALIAPVLLTLYLGGVEVTRAITFSHKMQRATTAVNDLVTQSTDLSKASVLETFDAADAMLAPFHLDPIPIRTTAINVDAAGNAKVVWSVARGMDKASAGKAYVLPELLKGLRNYTLVVTNASYAFSPISTYVLTARIPMSAEARGRFRGQKPPACSDCTK